MRLKKLLYLLLIALLISATVGGCTNIIPEQNSSDLAQDDLQKPQTSPDYEADVTGNSTNNHETETDKDEEPVQGVTGPNPPVSDPVIQAPVTTLVTGVSVNISELKIIVKETTQLKSQISPSNATEQGLTWSSSHPKIATVNSSGLITAKANGIATITVTTKCGSKKATAKVTVTTPVTGISLEYSTLTLVDKYSAQLSPKISPSTASDKGITWTSSDPAVASVSSSGRVTAKSNSGTAIITGTTNDGGKAVTVTVKVTDWTTAAASDELLMISLVNQEREKVGLSPLSLDLKLTTVARIKSQDILYNDYFAHESPLYGSPFDMMKQFGISFTAAGENLALYTSVESAHEALMESEGHRNNILNDKYTHIGIGIAKCSKGRLYITQMFIIK